MKCEERACEATVREINSYVSRQLTPKAQNESQHSSQTCHKPFFCVLTRERMGGILIRQGLEPSTQLSLFCLKDPNYIVAYT